MASATCSIKLSPDLDEAVKLRAKNLGYASLSAYIKGLMRYDLMVQGQHVITRPYSHLRLEEQDQIDGKLLGLTKTGVGVRGNWLEATMREIVGDERMDEVTKKLADECAAGD